MQSSPEENRKVATRWLFYRNEVPEVVQPELWRWQVVYKDGSIFKQFDDDHIFHQFKEIDQDRVEVFEMVSEAYEHKYRLVVEPGMKLIHFYRRTKLSAGTPEEVRIVLYVYGYIIGDHTKYFVIMPNNDLIFTDDLNKIGFEGQS